jgi:hypothetical protein
MPRTPSEERPRPPARSRAGCRRADGRCRPRSPRRRPERVGVERRRRAVHEQLDRTEPHRFGRRCPCLLAATRAAAVAGGVSPSAFNGSRLVARMCTPGAARRRLRPARRPRPARARSCPEQEQRLVVEEREDVGQGVVHGGTQSERGGQRTGTPAARRRVARGRRSECRSRASAPRSRRRRPTRRGSSSRCRPRRRPSRGDAGEPCGSRSRWPRRGPRCDARGHHQARRHLAAAAWHAGGASARLRDTGATKL